MDDWYPGDEPDWLSGEATYKKDRLRRELRRLGGHVEDPW